VRIEGKWRKHFGKWVEEVKRDDPGAVDENGNLPWQRLLEEARHFKNNYRNRRS
jgi:hypothetical protein